MLPDLILKVVILKVVHHIVIVLFIVKVVERLAVPAIIMEGKIVTI